MRLIFLPGMANNERIFSALLRDFPGLEVPMWIEPKPHESFESYVERFAHSIKGDPAEMVLIGFSFGGFVAHELSKKLHVKKVLMISSSIKPFPLWHRLLVRSLYHLVIRPLPQCLMRKILTTLVMKFVIGYEKIPMQYQRDLLLMLKEIDLTFLKWVIYAVSTWKKETPLSIDTSVFHIHGTRDMAVMPPKNKPNYTYIKGAKHIIPWTHPDVIAEWIKAHVAR